MSDLPITISITESGDRYIPMFTDEKNVWRFFHLTHGKTGFEKSMLPQFRLIAEAHNWYFSIV